MDPMIYIAAAGVVIVCIIILTFLKKSGPTSPPQDVAPVARPVAARRGEVAGGVRRGGPRRRMGARPTVQDDEETDPEMDIDDVPVDADGQPKKLGAKKMAKLQEKAERRSHREAEEEERREQKKRRELLELQQKKEEERRKADEAAEEEEEAKRREEQERKEHEEYLKLKEAFTVDEEGTHESELDQDTESLLQQFINYLKDMKVIMLEDLAAHFKIKTQDAIDRINTLLDEGRISGVLDDRGKFIYITQEEYEAVAKFIKQRGRVSITELAVSSNKLINLNPENLEVHKKLVGGVS